MNNSIGSTYAMVLNEKNKDTKLYILYNHHDGKYMVICRLLGSLKHRFSARDSYLGAMGIIQGL